MSAVAGPRDSYDQIAGVYDHDMGLNMPFDDVSYYVRLALERPASVLELGAGTGRITLALAGRRLNVTAVDVSARMLAVLRSKQNSMHDVAPACLPKLVQMDIRDWALAGKFSTILCPYSLITYLVEPSEQRAFLRQVRERLGDGGQFIVDAFVPDETIRHGEEVSDYRRLLPSGDYLERSKVVQGSGERQVNIIRRYYSILSPGGEPLRRFITAERIRCFYPGQLEALMKSSGFEIVRADWDYSASPAGPPARFFTLCCRVSQSLPEAQSFGP